MKYNVANNYKVNEQYFLAKLVK